VEILTLNLFVMDIIKFTTGFAEIFEDEDASIFNEGTCYQELDEWSSLTVLGVIAFIKTSCGVTVTGKEIRDCETIRELFDFVNSKKGE